MENNFYNNEEDPIKDCNKEKKPLDEFDKMKILIRINCSIFFLIVLVFEVSMMFSFVRSKEYILLGFLGIVVLIEFYILMYFLKKEPKKEE